MEGSRTDFESLIRPVAIDSLTKSVVPTFSIGAVWSVEEEEQNVVTADEAIDAVTCSTDEANKAVTYLIDDAIDTTYPTGTLTNVSDRQDCDDSPEVLFCWLCLERKTRYRNFISDEEKEFVKSLVEHFTPTVTFSIRADLCDYCGRSLAKNYLYLLGFHSRMNLLYEYHESINDKITEMNFQFLTDTFSGNDILSGNLSYVEKLTKLYRRTTKEVRKTKVFPRDKFIHKIPTVKSLRAQKKIYQRIREGKIVRETLNKCLMVAPKIPIQDDQVQSTQMAQVMNGTNRYTVDNPSGNNKETGTTISETTGQSEPSSMDMSGLGIRIGECFTVAEDGEETKKTVETVSNAKNKQAAESERKNTQAAETKTDHNKGNASEDEFTIDSIAEEFTEDTIVPLGCARENPDTNSSESVSTTKAANPEQSSLNVSTKLPEMLIGEQLKRYSEYQISCVRQNSQRGKIKSKIRNNLLEKGDRRKKLLKIPCGKGIVMEGNTRRLVPEAIDHSYKRRKREENLMEETEQAVKHILDDVTVKPLFVSPDDILNNEIEDIEDELVEPLFVDVASIRSDIDSASNTSINTIEVINSYRTGHTEKNPTATDHSSLWPNKPAQIKMIPVKRNSRKGTNPTKKTIVPSILKRKLNNALQKANNDSEVVYVDDEELHDNISKHDNIIKRTPKVTTANARNCNRNSSASVRTSTAASSPSVNTKDESRLNEKECSNLKEYIEAFVEREITGQMSDPPQVENGTIDIVDSDEEDIIMVES